MLPPAKILTTSAPSVLSARTLARKVRRYRVETVAFLGIDAYRTAMRLPKAQVGVQPVSFAGARVWALPNPSGLNAHYQLEGLVAAYAELARELARLRRSSTAP